MKIKNLEAYFIIYLLVTDFLPFFLKDCPLFFIVFFMGILNFPALIGAYYFYILPNIEKKVGHKLEYGMYVISIFEIFSKIVEVNEYIIKKYLSVKFRSNKWLFLLSRNNALYKINYSVEQMSKFEIFFCFYIFFLGILFIFCCIAFHFNWQYTLLDVINYFKSIYEKLF